MSFKDGPFQPLSTNELSAKELARTKGLAKKVFLSLKKDNESKVKQSQRFKYLIVLDFESTCWENRKMRYTPEVIEFPAVLLNTSTGQLESEFHSYVQPSENSKLSAFCTELTGITQAQINESIPIGTCLMMFKRWLQELKDSKGLQFPCGSMLKTPQGYASQASSSTALCTFVTWSDWDLGTCLKNECHRKQLRVPHPLRSWIDLRATYQNFYGRKPQGLAGALQELGIQFSGREHSGIDDARNTACLAWRMICDGCIMQTTKCLDGILSQNIAKGQENIPNRTKPVNYKYPYSAEKMNGKLSCAGKHQERTDQKRPFSYTTLKRKATNSTVTWVDTATSLVSEENTSNNLVRSFIEPITSLSVLKQARVDCMDIKCEQRNTTLAPKRGLVRQTLIKQCTTRDNNNHQLHTCMSKRSTSTSEKCEIEDQPCKAFNMQDYCDVQTSHKQQTESTLHAQKLIVPNKIFFFDTVRCSEMRQTISGPVTNLTTGILTSTTTPMFYSKQSSMQGPCSSNQMKSNPSLTPSPGNQFTLAQQNTPKMFFVRQGHPVTPALSISVTVYPHITPPQPASLNGGRVTPPVCHCGRRTSRRLVINPGPNQERAFFTCSCKPMMNASSKSKNNHINYRIGCNFFKWEIH